MTITTLQERIEKANEKIARKEGTIEKKSNAIAKKEAELVNRGYANMTLEQWYKIEKSAMSEQERWDISELLYDIKHLNEDIKRNTDEIAETKKTIAKYEAQLAGEIERESILLKDIPETMKRMQDELVEEWDAWDIARRDRMREDRRTMEYRDFVRKYRHADRDFADRSDEQIHNANIRDAKALVLNLYYRVKAITGEVVDWDGISLTHGNMGAVLNGFVIGKEGRAYVESILAGGYNIQRLHVRTLVHER